MASASASLSARNSRSSSVSILNVTLARKTRYYPILVSSYSAGWVYIRAKPCINKVFENLSHKYRIVR